MKYISLVLEWCHSRNCNILETTCENPHCSRTCCSFLDARNNPSYTHRIIAIKIQRKNLLFSRRQSLHLQHKSLEGVINCLLSVVAILQFYCFNCLNFKLEKISAFPVLSVHTHTQELFSNFIFLVICKMFYYQYVSINLNSSRLFGS